MIKNINNFWLIDIFQGICPKCGYNHAYGDQCESCGSTLSPTELIDPKSTLSGDTPILKETTHWYLPMKKNEKWLKQWIEKGILDEKKIHDPKKWKNNVLGQCKSWIDGGLQSQTMTRDLDWGVKSSVKGGENKVLYVWLDVQLDIFQQLKNGQSKKIKNGKITGKALKLNLLILLEKIILFFHCIIFPIILKEHGEFILPTNVPANEFLNLEGGKIYPSRNHAIWVNDFMNDFPEKEDVLRYVLCAIAPENKDADFTWKDFRS